MCLDQSSLTMMDHDNGACHILYFLRYKTMASIWNTVTFILFTEAVALYILSSMFSRGVLLTNIFSA